MTIREARKKAGYTMRYVSNWLEIPYRTLQNWENEVRECPAYVEKLIVEKILKSIGKEKEKNMYKIIKDLGSMNGHDDIRIVELGSLGLVALNGWNGERYIDCYQCDDFGKLKEKGRENISLKPVQEPDKWDEDGEPESWETIGYE